MKYFHGTTNITSAVVDGTFTTPSLAPGEHYLVKVKVRRDADSFDANDIRRLVLLTSVGNPSRTDSVKVVLDQVVCGC